MLATTGAAPAIELADSLFVVFCFVVRALSEMICGERLFAIWTAPCALVFHGLSHIPLSQ
jgi:hypothetical protein